jgi:hypothetical protein
MASPLENTSRYKSSLLTEPAASRAQGRAWKYRLLAAGAACALAALPLSAQQQTYGSSSAHVQLVDEDIDGASLGSSPAGEAAAASPAPQYGGGYGGYSGYHESKWSHLAFEAGGGVTIPIGNDRNGGFTTLFGNAGNYGATTWGGNVLAGAGWSFSKRFTLMGEWQYNDNKIPGKTLSAVYDSISGLLAANGYDASSIGGNVHLNSITAEPIFYYMNSDKRKYSGYLIGGAGYYHQSINFTAPAVVDSFYGEYVVNSNVESYTNNAWGVNLGTGVSYKIFGPDSRAKIFAEARYVFADTPRETTSDLANGNVIHIGTEEQIPVSVGFRF